MKVELVAGGFVDEQVGRDPELDAQVEAAAGDAVWVQRVAQVEPPPRPGAWRYAEAEEVRFGTDLQFLTYLEQVQCFVSLVAEGIKEEKAIYFNNPKTGSIEN